MTRHLQDLLKLLPLGTAALIQRRYLGTEIYPLKKRSGSPSDDMITVGRAANNDIVIKDITISRSHGFFRHRHEKFVFVDVGSKHGTFLNNVALEAHKEIEIASGDSIRFGDVTVHFYALAELYERLMKNGDLTKAMANDAARAARIQYSEEALMLARVMRWPVLITLQRAHGSPDRAGLTHSAYDDSIVHELDFKPSIFIVRLGPGDVGSDGSEPSALVTIGGSPRYDVWIADHSISRVQSTISFDTVAQRYYITDEYSHNGTMINQEPLIPGTATPIKSGDIVSFGKFSCRFLG